MDLARNHRLYQRMVTDAIWIQLPCPRNREPPATSNVPASVRAVQDAILPIQVRNTRQPQPHLRLMSLAYVPEQISPDRHTFRAMHRHTFVSPPAVFETCRTGTLRYR